MGISANNVKGKNSIAAIRSYKRLLFFPKFFIKTLHRLKKAIIPERKITAAMI